MHMTGAFLSSLISIYWQALVLAFQQRGEELYGIRYACRFFRMNGKAMQLQMVTTEFSHV